MISGFFRSNRPPKNFSATSGRWDTIPCQFQRAPLTLPTTEFCQEISKIYRNSSAWSAGIDPQCFFSSWTEANLPEPLSRALAWGFAAHGFVFPAVPTLLPLGSRLEFSNLLTGAVDAVCE